MLEKYLKKNESESAVAAAATDEANVKEEKAAKKNSQKAKKKKKKLFSKQRAAFALYQDEHPMVKKIVTVLRLVLGNPIFQAALGMLLSIFFLNVLPKSYSIFRIRRIRKVMIWIGASWVLYAFHKFIPKKFRKSASIAAFFLLPIYSFYAMELINGGDFAGMSVRLAFYNYVFYLLVYGVFLAVTGRFRVASVFGLSTFIVYAIANAAVNDFRGVIIRAFDVAALGTGLSVAGNYRLLLSVDEVVCIGWIVAIIALLCATSEQKITWKLYLTRGVAVACIIALVGSSMLEKTFIEDKGLRPYSWNESRTAKANGTFLNFAVGFAYLKYEEPEDYSSAKVQEAMEKAEHESNHIYTGQTLSYEDPSDDPNVIVIMNESWSDLTIYGDAFEATEDPLDYYHAMNENTVKGYMYVPVKGAGTSNSEYEFMTGNTLGFFYTGVYAYQGYVKAGSENVTTPLEDYHTIFLHPYLAKGWNRNNVYNNYFDFDEVYFLDQFQNNDKIRSYVSDSADFKEVIDRYEAAKAAGNDKIFVMNVTMQNHGGYTKGLKEVKVTSGSYPKANEYLTLMRHTDEALEELINYFKSVDEDVIICMFGDHQPKIESDYLTYLSSHSGVRNDYEKAMLSYKVPYMIWSNYDMEEQNISDFSCNYLSTLLFDCAGIQHSDYQDFLGGMYQEYPVVSVNGCRDTNGQWFNIGEDILPDTVDLYRMVQYANVTCTDSFAN